MRNTVLPPKLRIIWEDPKGDTSPIICPANLPETLSQKSILAEMCTPPGGTLSQTKYGNMVGQRKPRNKPRYHKTRDCGSCWGAAYLGPLTLLLPLQVPPPQKALLSQGVCLLGQVLFQCPARARPRALERVSLLVIRSWILPCLSTLRFQKITWYT